MIQVLSSVGGRTLKSEEHFLEQNNMHHYHFHYIIFENAVQGRLGLESSPYLDLFTPLPSAKCCPVIGLAN